MNSIDCYFCHESIEVPSNSGWSFFCTKCPAQHQLRDVITIKNYGLLSSRKVEIFYAHIYYDELNNSELFTIHVRLHLLENFTAIFKYPAGLSAQNINKYITVPGFPITVSNIKEKVKLYLLFS